MMKKRLPLSIAFIVMIFSLLLPGCGVRHAADADGTAARAASATESPGSDYPLAVTDQSGRTVTIPAQPKHIVSATEGTDEILSALVPKMSIAMMTSYADDPAYSNIADFAKDIPKLKDPNAETIIAAKPDLVLLASYTKQGIVDQIEQANIPVYEFTDFTSISGIERNIRITGRLIGRAQQANQAVDAMEEKLDGIEAAVAGQAKPTVLDYSSYGFAAGTGTTVDDVIVHAGGLNAAAKLQGWQKVSDEQIVALNPDVIIVSAGDKGFADKLRGNAGLQTVNAVKNNRIYEIDGADLSAVSQYIVDGVADVAHALYPDVPLP